jgi:hypothetical protein
MGLALLAATMTAVPAQARHKCHKVWWYVSKEGPLVDECANPYYFANHGYHPYPYHDRTLPNGAPVTGPYMYWQNGHVHEAPDDAVVAAAPAPAAPPPPPAAEPPPPPPAPEVPPPCKPEGD